MNKNLSKLICLFCSFILLFSVGFLAGCDSDEDEYDNYGSNIEQDIENTTQFAINYTEYVMFVGDTVKLITNSTSYVSWSTDNSYVATVSYGTVTARGKGYARITAKNADGKKVYCDIVVEEKIATKQKISVNSYNVKNYAEINVISTSFTNKRADFKATINLSDAYKADTIVSVSIMVRLTIKYRSNYGTYTTYKSFYLHLSLMSSYKNSDYDTGYVTYNYDQIVDADFDWDISSCYGYITER